MQSLRLLSDTGEVKKRHRTYSDSTANRTAETEYLRTARLGGGHKGIKFLMLLWM